MNLRTASKAFTLIELLVAAAITVVLTGLVLALSTQTLGLWQRTQGHLAAAVEAKLVLDAIERDLEAAIVRLDGKNWLRVDIYEDPTVLQSHGWLMAVPAGAVVKPTVESRRVLPNPLEDGTAPRLTNARFGVSGTWLRLVTSQQLSLATETMPSAVSYQIARRPIAGAVSINNPADVRYTLFRSDLSHAATFGTVQTMGYTSLTVPAGLVNPPMADALGSNVVDFGLWLYAEDGAGGLVRIYPLAGGGMIQSFFSGMESRMPVVADVMVRILTEEGAAILAAMEGAGERVQRHDIHASAGEWWWDVVEKHSEVFIRRVSLRGRGP